ncbi:hypothetical protein BLNAU_7037 [Blattamonas nauphoetae]|uniref:Uncharacterized protein n=1 Tax=Blattamonas nauphoetae TaxID=2049346 RepID=A0ABQ9Y295_9EUKA|nr:hypothetical protein BLNAU_7037 [Blattamonas nauphoetae]
MVPCWTLLEARIRNVTEESCSFWVALLQMGRSLPLCSPLSRRFDKTVLAPKEGDAPMKRCRSFLFRICLSLSLSALTDYLSFMFYRLEDEALSLMVVADIFLTCSSSVSERVG